MGAPWPSGIRQEWRSYAGSTPALPTGVSEASGGARSEDRFLGINVGNADQFEYWNGPEGEHWVEHEARFDGMLTPFVEPLLDAANLAATDRVLDVGCGNGATTRAAAARAASVVGLDISAPMVERARRRAREVGIDNVEFIHGDAQVHPFRPEFDVVLSRFGVMFFEDPVAAFRNLATAVVPGGRVAFVCWQELIANEWIATLAAALVPITGPPDVPPPGAPGPFSLAAKERVTGILTDAGFRGVTIDGLHVPVLLGGGLGVDDTVEFLASGGMAQRFLGDADAATVRRAKAALREVLAPNVSPAGIELGSAAWLVRAHR